MPSVQCINRVFEEVKVAMCTYMRSPDLESFEIDMILVGVGEVLQSRYMYGSPILLYVHV